MKKFILILCLINQLCNASPTPSTLYMQTSGHFGRSIWTDQPYARIGIYSVPDLSKASLGMVIQEEAFFLSDNQLANSVGLEFRVADRRKTICGINAFYDYFKGHFGAMNQVGAGLEVLTSTLSFHLNGYLPFHVTGNFGKTKVSDNFVGPYVLFSTPVEFLYQGFEFTLDQGWDFVDFYLYGSVGGYYIDDFFKNKSFGFQAKADIWWHPFFSMGFLYTRDSLFKNSLEGYVQISIPFSSIVTNTFPARGCCDYLSGRGGKTARIPRWGLGCPGCATCYKTSWKPTCGRCKHE